MGDAHLGVKAGGVGLGVAEELLDVAKIGPAFQHVGGAGVAQQVRATFGNIGLTENFGKMLAEAFGGEAGAQTAEEEFSNFLADEQSRADFVEITGEPVQGAGADGHDALFVALALSHTEGGAFGVEIFDAQSGEFATPEAGAVKEFEHGAVADA